MSIPILLVIRFYFASAAPRHAIVLSTTPSLRGTVPGPDVPIKIRFNSRIDSRRSRLTLLAPDGNQTVLGIVEAASGDSLISEAKGLKSGTYLLRWQVLALEPHRTYTSLLIAGSLPVMGVGLSHDYISFLTFRLEVAAIGASFLITQFHNSVMFGPNIVGTANATATGWATSAAA